MVVAAAAIIGIVASTFCNSVAVVAVVVVGGMDRD